jgi:hypothetical protein
MIQPNFINIALAILLTSFFYVGFAALLRWEIKRQYKSILSTAKDIRPKLDDLNNEIKQTEALEDSRVRGVFGRLTITFSTLEFLFFAGITFCRIQLFDHNNSLVVSKDIAFLVAAWLGIKIVGSYQQWSSVVLGRAYYYIFLIGSWVNIGVAIFTGWLLSRLF